MSDLAAEHLDEQPGSAPPWTEARRMSDIAADHLDEQPESPPHEPSSEARRMSDIAAEHLDEQPEFAPRHVMADTAVIGSNGNGPAPGPADPLVGLEARAVSAWFGSHKVLERVSLRMEPGTVTALIGPSGCGKSTFLRILNRMHEMVKGAALGGEVLLGEEDIYLPGSRPSDIRRRIGMVFQKPNPFPAMSVYDNVASGLKLAGIKVRDKDFVVESSLRRAGLWNEVHRRLKSPGGALSGGQQQRLCIARSLAVEPSVLLMDEPCSALDPTSTRRVEETIAELQGQVTIVIVTHNMQQAQRVSKNCAFFLAAENTPGHIVEAGPTERVFDSPADPRTADYVHGRFG